MKTGGVNDKAARKTYTFDLVSGHISTEALIEACEPSWENGDWGGVFWSVWYPTQQAKPRFQFGLSDEHGPIM